MFLVTYPLCRLLREVLYYYIIGTTPHPIFKPLQLLKARINGDHEKSAIGREAMKLDEVPMNLIVLDSVTM